MKVLILADEEVKSLGEYYDPEKTRGVDLIISCGDLNHRYLEFLETMVNCPLLYVKGNHDICGFWDSAAACGTIRQIRVCIRRRKCGRESGS